jgi:hypothetical protein
MEQNCPKEKKRKEIFCSLGYYRSSTSHGFLSVLVVLPLNDFTTLKNGTFYDTPRTHLVIMTQKQKYEYRWKELHTPSSQGSTLHNHVGHSFNNLFKCQTNNVVNPKVVTKLVASISFSCSNYSLETIQIAK